ncbi:MAG: ornithine cyclodeaminase family protein [Solirubrobacterales bacterium]
MIPVIGNEAVLAAVSAGQAIDVTRRAFERHTRGEWEMPPKVYLDSPPHGDFRAMPARGDGFALLKWVTSFPGNVGGPNPVVSGTVLLSDATTGRTLAIIDGRAVTALRTGAAAAVSAKALAAEGARSVGIVGCGVHGAWAARCLVAAGFGPGVCADIRPEAAESLADEMGWRAGPVAEAIGCDIVVTVTPGDRAVLGAEDLRPGQHLAALGADAHQKAELTVDALDRCRLFCDEWEQASTGGELAGAVAAGRVVAEQVTPLGSVLVGDRPGRESAEEITLFDSTGLAIQDLAVAIAVYEGWRSRKVDAATVEL